MAIWDSADEYIKSKIEDQTFAKMCKNDWDEKHICYKDNSSYLRICGLIEKIRKEKEIINIDYLMNASKDDISKRLWKITDYYITIIKEFEKFKSA